MYKNLLLLKKQKNLRSCFEKNIKFQMLFGSVNNFIRTKVRTLYIYIFLNLKCHLKQLNDSAKLLIGKSGLEIKRVTT